MSSTSGELFVSAKYASRNLPPSDVLFNSIVYFKELPARRFGEFRAEAWFYSLIEFNKGGLDLEFQVGVFEIIQNIVAKRIRGQIYEDLLFSFREIFKLTGNDEFRLNFVRAIQRLSERSREEIEAGVTLLFLYCIHIRTYCRGEIAFGMHMEIINRYCHQFLKTELGEVNQRPVFLSLVDELQKFQLEAESFTQKLRWQIKILAQAKSTFTNRGAQYE